MGKKNIIIMFVAVCLTLTGTASAESSAQRREPYAPDRGTAYILDRFSLSDADIGVYYVPPPEQKNLGFIFDDIPREEVTTTSVNLTEKRLKKEGKFVKFTHRRITYSLMETVDDSVRFNAYPSKKAVMFNWTHAIPVVAKR